MDIGVIESRKALKRNRILQTVRYHDGISRSEVKKATGYSMTTVLNLIDELLARGMLREEVSTQVKTGRRPSWLHVCADGAYSIGVEFNADLLCCVVLDFKGDSKHQILQPLSASATGSEVMEKMESAVAQACAFLGTRRQRLIGIGVGVPGYLNREKGMALAYAHMPEWRNVSVESSLRQRFQCPVWLENNINTTAIAYRHQKYTEHSDDFILLSIKYGIRIGMYLNNALFVGGGNAGEIGHIRLAGCTRFCSCGQRGCLDTEASFKAIRTKLMERMDCGKFAALRGQTEGEAARITMERLAAQALSGDTDAVELLHETAVYLAQGLSMVVASLNPRQIVVASGSDLSATDFPTVLLQELKKLAPAGLTENLKISCIGLEQTMGAVGAASMALERAFPVAPLPFDP